MRFKRLIIAAAVAGAFALTSGSAYAQRGRPGGGHAPAAGHAVARPPLPSRPLGGFGHYYGYPYRYYGYYGRYYWPAFGFGFGYPYGYLGFGYPYYPYYGWSPYPYYWPYATYPYGYYGYGPYGYGAYGGVRLDLPIKDAGVYVDGRYVGVVDDFDGPTQQLTLEPGPHRIEVRGPGAPLAFEVNVQPGRTIHYRGTR